MINHTTYYAHLFLLTTHRWAQGSFREIRKSEPPAANLPDAGRPSRGKAYPDKKSPNVTCRMLVEMKSLFPHKKVELEDSSCEKSEDDHQDPPSNTEGILILRKQGAQQR